MKKVRTLKEIRGELRVRELDTVPPMYIIEEYKKTGHAKVKKWSVLCLSPQREIAEGVVDDIARQTFEKHNAVRQ